MIKRDEMSLPTSCLNKAEDDEPIFVLLGRDEDAPQVIRRWCIKRVDRGKNAWDDEQIQEALALANKMEEYRRCRKQKSS